MSGSIIKNGNYHIFPPELIKKNKEKEDYCQDAKSLDGNIFQNFWNGFTVWPCNKKKTKESVFVLS